MRSFLAALMIVFTHHSAALAQLQLPGATPAQSVKKVPPKLDADGLPIKHAKTGSVKTPGEDAIVSRELTLNGARGRIEFARAGDALNVVKLTLDGSQISRPDDACRVEVVAGAPLSARPLGRPAGALRYGIALEACPFTFDVLDGAVLVGAEPAICEFKAADCRVSASGLWGPRASALGPERAKEIERARNLAETTMRENFRDLLARTSGRASVKSVASEQAGFTSRRAEICQDYAREDVHGFCALRITEARGMLLRVEIGANGKDASEQKEVRKKRKRGAVPL